MHHIYIYIYYTEIGDFEDRDGIEDWRKDCNSELQHQLLKLISGFNMYHIYKQ